MLSWVVMDKRIRQEINRLLKYAKSKGLKLSRKDIEWYVRPGHDLGHSIVTLYAKGLSVYEFEINKPEAKCYSELTAIYT